MADVKSRRWISKAYVTLGGLPAKDVASIAHSERGRQRADSQIAGDARVFAVTGATLRLEFTSGNEGKQVEPILNVEEILTRQAFTMFYVHFTTVGRTYLHQGATPRYFEGHG